MLELESPFFVFSLGKMILVMLLGFVPLNDAFNHLNLRMGKQKGLVYQLASTILLLSFHTV